MINLSLAFALIMVIEGLCYVIMPGKMKEMMELVQRLPDEKLHIFGLVSVLFGLAWVWFIVKF